MRRGAASPQCKHRVRASQVGVDVDQPDTEGNNDTPHGGVGFTSASWECECSGKLQKNVNALFAKCAGLVNPFDVAIVAAPIRKE